VTTALQVTLYVAEDRKVDPGSQSILVRARPCQFDRGITLRNSGCSIQGRTSIYGFGRGPCLTIRAAKANLTGTS
jgi:hypothetical protein